MSRFIQKLFRAISASCFFSFAALTAPLSAETLVYEGFDIPPGTGALHEASGATSFGWDGPWRSDPGSAGNNTSFNVAEQGLAYDGATSGFGGAMEVANGLESTSGNYYIGNVNSHFRNLDRSYSEGELWFGFLAKPSVRIEGGPGGFFQVMLTSSSFFYVDGRHLGVGANGWGDIMWMVGGHLVQGEISSPFSMLAGDLVFMVVRVDFEEPRVSMWANPDPTVSDPGTPIWTQPLVTNEAGEALLEVSRIAIFDASHRTGSAVRDYSGTLIDQIRLGTTYASIVPRDGDEADTWNGYPVADGWADTGDWMDWVNVANDPWLYSPAFGWMEMASMDEAGAWVYLPR
ncbi:MAG: hypothetical protein JJU00_11215 [Opitutales bacterium]|nr:hypothetical protein [Opitutales bacterium]